MWVGGCCCCARIKASHFDELVHFHKSNWLSFFVEAKPHMVLFCTLLQDKMLKKVVEQYQNRQWCGRKCSEDTNLKHHWGATDSSPSQQPHLLPGVRPQTYTKGLNRNPIQPHDRLTDSAWSTTHTRWNTHVCGDGNKHINSHTSLQTEIATVRGIAAHSICPKTSPHPLTYITLRLYGSLTCFYKGVYFAFDFTLNCKITRTILFPLSFAPALCVKFSFTLIGI